MNAEQAETHALNLASVGFAYGKRRVLEDVSFSVPAGAFCVLLGINGAGKSTLFSLVTRLFACPRGDIRIYGHDLRHDSLGALACLGVVFQQPTLDLDITIEQNMRYHCALNGLNYSSMRSAVDAILAELDLEARRKDKVRQLSGGQRRRVELARALLHRPRLLLADEPTVGLDIHSREAILAQVRQRCREDGTGVLWATHLVDEVRDGDQVVVLHQGRVLARGSRAELLADTASESVSEAFNRLTGGAGE